MKPAMVPIGGWGPMTRAEPLIKAGQIRRFKNANYDVRYVVLSYSKARPDNCHVMMLDEHDFAAERVGSIYEYDHSSNLFAMSTECDP